MVSKINKLHQTIFLMVSLQFPALSPLFKYVPENLHFLVIVFLFIMASFYFLWQSQNFGLLKQSLNTPWPTIIIIMLFFTASIVVYPLADNLKEIGRGSDQDNAIIEGAQAFFANGSPYFATTYYGNPISAGPGWIILLMPLALSGFYLLINPISLLVLTIVILKTT